MNNATNSNIRDEIESLIKQQPTTMSKYQIDNFVISDKMTNYKILKQILLELGTRYVGFEELKLNLEIEKLECEKMEEDLKKYNKRYGKNL